MQRLLGFFLICMLAACEQFPGLELGGNTSLLANQDSQRASANGSNEVQDLQAALNGPNGNTRRIGTDNFLGQPVRNAENLVEVGNNGEITLNLLAVPIEDAARAVLGEALQQNYAIQPGVTGTITLQTTRPLTERGLLETFETVLALNGATLQVEEGLISVVPIAGAPLRVRLQGGTGNVGSRVVAVPLQFIGTAEMSRLLEPIAGGSVRLQEIPRRNILLVSGTRGEINAAIEAINLFDVDVLKGKSVGLYRLRAAEPEAVVEELDLIFETGAGGSLENVLTFVPSQRLAAVLVVSTRASYLSEAERWIRDLDRTAGGTKRRPVVYSLQNRSASELAPILSDMLDAPPQEEGAQIVGTARVVADDTKNAVIVWGNDTEQESFSRLIYSLDTTPVQVLLEATIAEVSLNDDLDFGLRWFFESGNFSGTFSDATSGTTGSTFPGLSFAFSGGSSSVTLNALSSVTDVNVVSSPSLLVLDNQEATLQIGDEVPVATQEVTDTSSPDAPVVSTISFRDTGIILTVRPRVSTSGRVLLDIEQEVSTVAETTTSGIDSPTISTRRITTSVAVDSGQTIALGGLIQESGNVTTSKVPGVGDVPILGALFRNRSDRFGKTELLVMITPQVIRNGSEARSVTDELRQRIQGADGLVRSGVAKPQEGHRILR